MISGQFAVGSGQWAGRSGQRAVDSGQFVLYPAYCLLRASPSDF